jgi:hypothetical protein
MANSQLVREYNFRQATFNQKGKRLLAEFPQSSIHRFTSVDACLLWRARRSAPHRATAGTWSVRALNSVGLAATIPQ